jgi:hypothetical protein
MKKRITDRQIRKFFWEADELPLSNKAAYMLGDLINYGVSRCVQISSVLKSVYYEFDIYREEESIVTLVVELPIDFTLKSIERAIVFLYKNGGTVASNDMRTFQKWKKKIKTAYTYDHAKYSATRFLEALRGKMLVNGPSGKRL